MPAFPTKTLFFAVLAANALGAVPAQADVPAETPEIRAAKQNANTAELLEIVRTQQTFFNSLNDNGVSELERSRRAAAIAARYENFLAENPNNAEALVLFAKFMRAGGENKAAREHFEKAAKLRPDWAVAQQQLAAIAAENGDASEALRRMRAAVELDPGTPDYQTQLGEILRTFRAALLHEKIFASARELDAEMQNAFRAASALRPDALDEAVRYAESFYDVETPDFRAAADAWTRAKTLLGKFRGNAETRNFLAGTLDLHLARALAELGNFEEAGKLLRAVNDRRLARSREKIETLISEKRKNTSEKP